MSYHFEANKQILHTTLLWAPGEVVDDSFNLQVKADTPDGIYNLLVGLYLPVGLAPVSLPLMQDGQMSQVTNVSLGLIRVGHPALGLTLDTANPHYRLDQTFGDTLPAIPLFGYDLGSLSCQEMRDNCHLAITFYWRSESSLPVDYTTFVHVRNSASEVIAQKDQPLLDGAYPTSLWNPGEIIAEKVTVPVPVAPSPGSYQIVAGLYNFQTGQRLNIPDNPDNEVSLTNVELR